jgi:hypothetical protein
MTSKQASREDEVPAVNGREARETKELYGRTVYAEVIFYTQVRDRFGDCLQQVQYKPPQPISRADPEGRGRTIGQRVDEMVTRADARSVVDYRRATEVGTDESPE